MLLKDLNKDAVLLMYLSGELPGEDGLQVERMLAGDAQLRREFDLLREAWAATEGAIRAADKSEGLAYPAATAARRVGQQVRSWHARNGAAVPAAAQVRRSPRIPLWAYPLASAAAILIAFVWWYDLKPDAGPYVQQTPTQTRAPIAGPGAAVPVPLAASPADVYAYDGGAWSGTNVLAESADNDSEMALAEAEAELYALSDPAGDDDDVSTILMLGEIDEQ